MSDLNQINLIHSVMKGLHVSSETANLADSIAFWINLLGTPLLLATGFVFCAWIYRAHRNLGALGAAGLNHTPGWAAGSWFVPIANLFMPFQVMREIWKASDPTCPVEDANAWPAMESTAMLGWWWACWLGRSFLFQWGRSVRSSAVGPAGFLKVIYWNLAGQVVSLAGLVLLILIIREIDRRQTERHDLVFRWEAERLMPYS